MSINPRQVAAEVLIDVLINGAYSNILLPRTLNKSSLAPRDKSLVTELVYGTLRLKGRHDQRIASVANRPLAEIDPKVLAILEMGSHQLFEMRIPSYAAVSGTVDVARSIAGHGSSSFVNAVLRSLTNSNDHSSEQATHPDWIISSYKDALKSDEEVAELVSANNRPTTPTLVAWPGRSSINELMNEGATPLTGTQFAASYAGNPGELEVVRRRRAGVQDYGSQLVVEIFAQTKNATGLRWLDLCAGPGGKSALLSSLLDPHHDSFLANEISEPRAQLVKQVIAYGDVVNGDGRSLEHGTFDRILIDAPCSGIGALRRRPELRWRRSLNDVKNLAVLQSELLDAATTYLAPHGIIGYVTCSPHLHETRAQVRSFLKRHPDFSILPVSSLPISDAEVAKTFENAILDDGTFQLWTHKHQTDSMFMAMFSR